MKKNNKIGNLAPTKRRTGAITDEVIAEAIRKNKGIMLYASYDLGQSRSLVSGRVQQSPYLQAVVAECVEARLDNAEKSLMSLIEEKDLGSVCFLLKTIGKKRGYSEQKSQEEQDPEVLKSLANYYETLNRARERLKPPE